MRTLVGCDIGNITDPTTAGKCHMTVDASPSSQFKGTVYAVWTSTGKDASEWNRHDAVRYEEET